MVQGRRMCRALVLAVSCFGIFGADQADAQPRLPFKPKPATQPAAVGEPASTTAPSTPTTQPAPPVRRPGGLPFNRPGATATTKPATQPATVAATKPAEPRILPEIDEYRPFGYAGGVQMKRVGDGQLSGGRATDSANPYESDFLPITDRWRIGLPPNYVQNSRGNILDPYGQNVLKGDYALPGTQDIFTVIGLTSDTLVEARRAPTPSGGSAISPGKLDFFGGGDSLFVIQNFIVSGEVFKGDTAYRPKDWSIKATAVGNINYVNVDELGGVNPNVQKGSDRTDEHIGFQELLAELKLADLSVNYDFISVRAGIQGFTSDFRGFLYSDNEPGIRLFGSFDNNQWQFNLAWFRQLEKDSNSGLNTWDTRNQDVFVANLYRQDLIWKGYTGQLSFHANFDHGDSLQYDENGFLVRPAPIGTIGFNEVDAYYIGWAGDGHIGRVNISHQFYQALGRESANPIAGRSVDINAQMAALELSIDYDYLRYRASFLYLSGDGDPTDGDATGFDTIFDNPNFAGGGFSYFTRQAIRLTGSGVGLVGRNSLTPSLRTSKEQGQANFVNPGLFLYNVGMDVELTPKLKMITNASYLQFADTSSLKLVLQDGSIGRDIGFDLSVGFELRPLLNNNVIMVFGVSALVPGQGFKDIYTSETLYSTFFAMTLNY